MKRLTSKTALGMVLRIEALHGQIDDVCAEVREYDGENNDSVILEAVKARAEQRDRADEASGLIGSFDWDGEGNRIGPDDEPAWPAMSAKLREAVGDNRRLLPLIDQIDKLHRLAIAQGLPVVSMAEFEAELERVGLA